MTDSVLSWTGVLSISDLSRFFVERVAGSRPAGGGYWSIDFIQPAWVERNAEVSTRKGGKHSPAESRR